MKLLNTLGLLCASGLAGCISSNPVITEPALEKIEENAKTYNQRTINIAANELLLNILRARDHSPRAYTSLSDVSMAPGGDLSRGLEAGGLGRGAAWTGFKGSVSWSSEDKLSYTLANASRSDGKNFADQGFDAVTFNDFWNQGWPRAMLFHIFFKETAREIVQGGNAADRLNTYYGLNEQIEIEGLNIDDPDWGRLVGGAEAFYVMADNGRLSYCLNALETCVEAKPKPKKDEKKGDPKAANAQNKDVGVNVAVSLQNATAPQNAAPEYVWKYERSESKLDRGYGFRIADEFLSPERLVSDVLYTRVNATSETVFPNKHKIIFCSIDKSKKVFTSLDYGQVEMLKPQPSPTPGTDEKTDGQPEFLYRTVNVFKCSTDLIDFENGLAQPYFLVLGSNGEASIHQPSFSTFDNAIYLLGRSLRPGASSGNQVRGQMSLQSRNTSEERFCSLFNFDLNECGRGKPMFRIHSAKDTDQDLFERCASSFIAEVKYKGVTYRAGLPERYDNNDDDCFEDSLTSTTLILLSKIVEYSIQRPEINTQLLITQ